MSTDTTFFTNEPNNSLLDRFKMTLNHTQYFDVLVGYFRTSGFHRLYKELETVDKIRILVGLNLDKKAYEIIDTAKQHNFDLKSNQKAKNVSIEATLKELNSSQDTFKTEIGIKKFIKFLTINCKNPKEDIKIGGNGKKLEFRVYPSENIHAKVYISRFQQEQISFGSVITGSSNFSASGLVANREFNVELKNKSDVDFALNQFKELWNMGVDISKEYVDTIQTKTWLNEEISPYHLYLKMIYEYLKEDINLDKEIDFNLPDGFMKLEYQQHAVLSAKKILGAYGGVFLADVVGLGKTFIASMLAQQLPGGKLIICPPVLKEYWEDTLFEFGVSKTKVESIGKLHQILQDGVEKYDTIFIDEAHRFRNEYTQGFEKLVEITYGKKVVLISATPLNNTFSDIFNQIKLFQPPKKSTIPGLPTLDQFFKGIATKLKKHKKSDSEYLDVLRMGSEEIREKVLKYIMIRRTRAEILNYFSKDMQEQGLFFPEIASPRRFIYKFNPNINNIFNKTIELLKAFKYSRYMPLLYLNRQMTEFEMQGQRNIGGFMKGILIKRLESSFFAFRKSLNRFVESYHNFINMAENGTIMISKSVNVYDLLECDDEAYIQALIDTEKLEKYLTKDFQSEYMSDLYSDLNTLEQIIELWKDVDSDPKLEQFITDLKIKTELKNQRILIFTESKETAEYVARHLNKEYPRQVMMFSSEGGIVGEEKFVGQNTRNKIKENYDPNYKEQKNDIKFLITTDVLAEGINLHRSNIVINYDLPWNPTRVLQRVGRINRVGTKHKKIFIYNFFPTDESNEHLGLEDNIKSKIQAFHDTLGEDAKYLSDDEVVSSHELFGDSLYKKLNSKNLYNNEEDEVGSRSELQYLKIIRDIRDNNPNLFEKVKRLPKKARSSQKTNNNKDYLITFLKKGRLKKFMKTDGITSQEITFFEAIDHFECKPNVKRLPIPAEYYNLLKTNKDKFKFITTDEIIEPQASRGGQSNEKYVMIRLKEARKHQGFTDDEEEYLKIVIERYNEGIIPQNTTKRIKKKIEKEVDYYKLITTLKQEIPRKLLSDVNRSDSSEIISQEIILSEYLVGGSNG